MSSWITKLKKSKTKFLAVPALVLATGGTALAINSSGGAQLQMLNATDNVLSATSSTAFIDVPGAVRVVGVGSPGQLINARLTAESNCVRAIPALGGQCSTRIVAQRPGGAPVELNPKPAVDRLAFDTVGTDGAESHAMESSIRLGVGTYIIRAQRAVSNPAVSFRIDNWHLAVEKSQ